MDTIRVKYHGDSVTRPVHELSSHLEQDFDEDTRGGGGVVLSQAHRVDDLPGYGVRCQQVAEEARDIAQLVGLQPMDQCVLAAEALLKAGLVLALQQAEALRQQPIVPAAAVGAPRHMLVMHGPALLHAEHSSRKPSSTFSLLNTP